MARQSGNPQGLFGRLLMALYLDRSNRVGNQLVYETLAFEPQHRVLEIGFGGGSLLFRIAAELDEGQMIGMELSQPMLRNAIKRARRLNLKHKTQFLQGTIERLPFEDQDFDRICSVNTVYFWPDIDHGLTELCRVLKPGATLVLGFGHAETLRQQGYEDRGFNLFSDDAIKDAMNRNGFEVDVLSSVERGERGPFFACRGVRSA